NRRQTPGDFGFPSRVRCGELWIRRCVVLVEFEPAEHLDIGGGRCGRLKRMRSIALVAGRLRFVASVRLWQQFHRIEFASLKGCEKLAPTEIAAATLFEPWPVFAEDGVKTLP